jgi:peptidyl-prolyl cis-trans isomerase A (cyclophilin A)
MKRLVFSVFGLLLASSAGATDGKFTALALKGRDLYATLSTEKGDIVIRFFPKDAPKTVANFVGLAAGEKDFTDPATGKQTRRPFYDGLTFHRIIKDFMIQGGDPEGSGRGGPGYTFEDEFQSGRAFDKPGLVAMANRGPNTNGSQFFITTSTPAHLNNRHTIFGEVIDGYDVVLAISELQGQKVRITKVVISEKGPPKKAAPAKKEAAR